MGLSEPGTPEIAPPTGWLVTMAHGCHINSVRFPAEEVPFAHQSEIAAVRENNTQICNGVNRAREMLIRLTKQAQIRLYSESHLS